MRTLHCACVVAALLLVACGAGGPSPTPRPTATAVSTPSPSPSPSLTPEVQQVDVVASGVGAFDLVAVPVAILHSEATRSTATGVVVHYSLTRRGATLFSLASEAVLLYPGQTAVVAANCTDTCNSADGVTQTVTVTAWTATTGGAITTDPATYACAGACKGRGYGDVTAVIHGESLLKDAPVDIFASCSTGPTTIVGGGQRSLIWPQSGGTVTLDVPVILSVQPTSCQLSASPASSTVTP